MRKFLIVLVVSVLILGAGAGVAEWYVRGKVVDQIVAQVEDATGSTPDVTLESFPVLLDLARGSLTSVAGSAGELAFEDLSLTDVDVHAAGVATGSAQSIDALTGTASGATIGALTLDDVALAADTVGFEPLAVNELEISAQALTAGGVVFDDVTLVAENVAVDPEFTADLVLTGRLSIEEVEALVRAPYHYDVRRGWAKNRMSIGDIITALENTTQRCERENSDAPPIARRHVCRREPG